ncbi:MAG: exodeoxyribonuclease III [Candidatus Zambryskibacteria bacterium RIFCSPHIGHO2_01_FULL_43_27]|uniref:Exodeoxyribonuclease III n=1 Tax=Candidatus Zambryskibacteria bacterium RIFCSPLOWO2_01_FULL_43_17 TaxID=1802760 RepID=A0A1G2U565_9BACT|nr:MAG: exodeoxyribonuclease III [Candidatus Zambryskibacteria bacterium RIFCSPHIGHO2_01_FULL_43_27]OHB00097.1 MAG: exodeoxyribonuclease III [Candidatus Zambryskibacteria bacterium RIFCSPHIGHO2_12_FULL_43_12b]OHB04628.1 MAG: exodeoxyribonuclease III [Candidatus Zambryskibacteria bacterium RIFCSPLOWO2_01_FULL_43_17]
MKIISWNVNGLRAVHRKDSIEWLFRDSPDIICLQETKSTPDQLPPELQSPPGYYAYFNSSDGRKGYSGTALYSKVEPLEVFYGIDRENDPEGRVVGAEYGAFYLLNVYFPNGGGGPDRLAYKLEFYKRFLAFIEKLDKKKPVIFCGDVNTAHKEIDLARPKENEKNTGFLPIERKWIDDVLSKNYVDVFRETYPTAVNAYTYWDMKTFARDRNVGWRIDYFFVSRKFLPNVKSTAILNDIFGSDHCPISLEIKN